MRKIVCLPQIICCHLFGDNHSQKHRAVCGGCISCIAFLIMGSVHNVLGEIIGTSLHAIGFHPIIETIQTKKPTTNENSNS